MSAKLKRKKGQTIQGIERDLIRHVIECCDKEAKDKHLIVPLAKATERAPLYCKVSQCTIKNIRSESRKPADENLLTPEKTRKRSNCSSTAMSLKKISSNKSFEGCQNVYSHESSELKCLMKFAIYLPAQVEHGPVPVIFWLSGLECNELNFIQKSGFQKYAAEHGFAVVCPDTSPRGCNIAGEEDSWDFGTGAGFYLDAVQPPWDKHYRMYSYVTKELPELIFANFPVDSKKQSIMGHSMGGHGALICALKNPYKYASVSAFSPVCNPTLSPWGKKVFSGYLGAEDIDLWKEYDATCLVAKYDGTFPGILIDQGSDDVFLPAGQLLPENFMSACQAASVPAVLKMREGYDHSYYFIATFIQEHFEFHAKHLK